MMNRDQAAPYVSYGVDDCMTPRDPSEAPPNARLVGWQCGFEPLFVAVWSYLPDTKIDDQEAEDLATDLLTELGWFAGDFRSADYIL